MDLVCTPLIEPLNPRERDLVAQLISVRRREALLEEQIEQLKEETERYKTRPKIETDGQIRLRLNHALAEIAALNKELRTKRKPHYLSDEEWNAVLEMRGICSS